MAENQAEPDVPTLTSSVEAPAELSLDKPFNVTIHVKLESDKPIIFHTHRIHLAFTLFRRLRGSDDDDEDDNAWEECPCDSTQGFLIVDDPDKRVLVSSHEDFTSLRPGETWSDEYTIHHPSGGDVPADAVAGDRFRCRFTGVELDWWDWGDAEEHGRRRTEVALPCFIKGDVTDPRHNDGRPRVRISASNDVDFVVKGG